MSTNAATEVPSPSIRRFPIGDGKLGWRYLHLTTDGFDPTTDTPVNAAPLVVGKMVVEALAVIAGRHPSGMLTLTFAPGRQVRLNFQADEMKPRGHDNRRRPCSIPPRPGQLCRDSEAGGIWWNTGAKTGGTTWASCTKLIEIFQEENGIYHVDHRPKFDAARPVAVQSAPGSRRTATLTMKDPACPVW